jgi:hypothetical protein
MRRKVNTRHSSSNIASGPAFAGAAFPKRAAKDHPRWIQSNRLSQPAALSSAEAAAPVPARLILHRAHSRYRRRLARCASPKPTSLLRRSISARCVYYRARASPGREARRRDRRLPSSKSAVSILQLWCILNAMRVDDRLALSQLWGSRRATWPRKRRRQRRQPRRKRSSRPAKFS